MTCPYTGSKNLIPAIEGTRPRPETITIMKCQTTGYFSAKNINGRVYPLSDRLDPDSDVVQKVIDKANFE